MFESDYDAAVCASCATRHTTGVITDRAADGCAGEATAEGVVCTYPSAYEDRRFAWTDRPDWVQDGVICDACVTKLIDAGALRETTPETAETTTETTPESDVAAEPSLIVCQTCGTRYAAIAPEEGLGVDCAATVDARGITAHYGSRYDGLFYPWRNRPQDIADGTICDACIARLLRLGTDDGPLAPPTELF